MTKVVNYEQIQALGLVRRLNFSLVLLGSVTFVLLKQAMWTKIKVTGETPEDVLPEIAPLEKIQRM